MTDPQWVLLERHEQKVELLGDMLAKFLRDNPRADTAAIAVYEAQVSREIGLLPGLP